jgi:3-oxoacyl-[acyl-carrier protein] reductase
MKDFSRFSDKNISHANSPRPVALVTGASRGIGLAIAQNLARHGYNLYLTCSRTMDALQKAAAQLSTEYNVTVTPVRCDMADPAAVRDLFAGIPRLDLLVNNAGISYVGLLQEMTDEEWNRIVSVNLSSVFYTSREAIPMFLKAAGSDNLSPDACPGRIINISSVWGNVGASCEAAYSATKGGINSLTKALGKELAPSHIPVNAIACGCVDTVMNDNLSEEEKADLAQEIPAGRFASPEEIAAALWQLASAPAYLTGQIITVDGGWI